MNDTPHMSAAERRAAERRAADRARWKEEAEARLAEADFSFIPDDRPGGDTSKLLFYAERHMRDAIDSGDPERTGDGYWCEITPETLVEYTVDRFMAAPESGRDTRAWRLTRSLNSILARAQPDLVLKDGRIERSEDYMLDRPWELPDGLDDLDHSTLTSLRPRGGYFADRINLMDRIIAEETARLAAGVKPVGGEARLHILLSVFGPQLVTSILKKIDAALAAPPTDWDDLV